jgi:hypothetical protein
MGETMKRLATLGILFLAACGGGAGSTGGNVNPSMANTSSAVVDAKIPNPEFNLSTILPDARSAHSGGVLIRSIKAKSKIKNRTITGLFKTGCMAADVNNALAGCGLIAENAYPNTIAKTEFSLYTQYGGKGCLLATGSLKKYTMYQYETFSVAWKLQNVKRCWQ